MTVTDGEAVGLDVQLADSGLGSIVGQVTDVADGAPIAGASVTVLGPDLPTVTTGPDGQYLLEDVPGGTYDLEIEAESYLPQVVEDVEVTDGQVTTVDVALVSAPSVVVVGDRSDQLTTLLRENSFQAEQASGWEVVDDLDGVDVLILNNPPNIGQDDFLDHLAAFDAAGVSVIFTADGTASRTRGIDLLVRHTGDPESFGRIGSSTGPEVLLHDLADHPLLAGIDSDPVQLLRAGGEAGFVTGYSGVTLATIAERGSELAGVGIAYNPRTVDSVHLILGGLAAAFNNDPSEDWTPDAQRIFLNAVRWAASPGLGTITGTVTDPDDEPIAGATVQDDGTGWTAATDANGAFELAVPAGEHMLNYQAFGYAADQRTLTVAANQTVDASVQLAVGEVGTITGVVTSREGGDALEGVRVELRGTPLETVTGADGSYTIERVEPGNHELELAVDGHVRTIAGVENVAVGETTVRDVALRESPLVGIIDDSPESTSLDRGKEFLTDWGYLAEDIGWDSLDRIAELDLVIVNLASFPNLDPGFEGFKAFEDAVNRAGVPVIWADQFGRGAIQYLRDYDNDPAFREDDRSDGSVTAHIVEDHPLVGGLPAEFPLTEDDREYAYFDDFGGVTVANLVTGDLGELGGTIGYKGRTAGAVDVLLSTLSIGFYGAPSTRLPAFRWTPEAERVYVNALAWALDVEGLGAEVRGTVESDRDGLIASQIEVLETGRTYASRDSDGTFLVPLQPGSWTLEVSAFGHEPQTLEVTVEAGDSLSPTVTLTADATGAIGGTVTGPDGAGIAGAEVTLHDSPRGATTGADGSYTIVQAPVGHWTLQVNADGFKTERRSVAVAAGQTTPVNVQLRTSPLVAVVPSSLTSAAFVAQRELLEQDGYAVEMVSREDMVELADRIGDYDLVIFNTALSFQRHRDGFNVALAAAEDAAVAVIISGHSGGTWPLNEISDQRGDPETVTSTNISVGLDLVPIAPHPIFAGYPVGERIELTTSTTVNLNQRLTRYEGFSGITIADVHARVDGARMGQSIGYRFSTPTSVELLLGNLTPAPIDGGFPGRGLERGRRAALPERGRMGRRRHPGGADRGGDRGRGAAGRCHGHRGRGQRQRGDRRGRLVLVGLAGR